MEKHEPGADSGVWRTFWLRQLYFAEETDPMACLVLRRCLFSRRLLQLVVDHLAQCGLVLKERIAVVMLERYGFTDPMGSRRCAGRITQR